MAGQKGKNKIYQRIMVFMLAFMLVFSNIGTNLAVVWADDAVTATDAEAADTSEGTDNAGDDKDSADDADDMNGDSQDDSSQTGDQKDDNQSDNSQNDNSQSGESEDNETGDSENGENGNEGHDENLDNKDNPDNDVESDEKADDSGKIETGGDENGDKNNGGETDNGDVTGGDNTEVENGDTAEGEEKTEGGDTTEGEDTVKDGDTIVNGDTPENEDTTTSGPADGTGAAGGTGTSEVQDGEKEQVGITYKVVPEDGAVVSGDDSADVGGTAVFFVELKDGYTIKSVTADGEYLTALGASDEDAGEVIASEDYEYEITDIQNDITVIIALEKDAEETEGVLSTECDGVVITVEAVAGEMNPDIVEVAATPLEDEALQEAMMKAAAEAGKAYEETRIFDIRLLDKDGRELQPGCKVKVSFALPDVLSEETLSEENTIDADVFYLKEETDSEQTYTAENMDGRVNPESGEIEFETTHFTFYAFGILSAEAGQSADVEYDLTTKWAVSYPELAAETSEGIEVEVIQGDYKGKPYAAEIIYTIPEGYSGQIAVNAMMDVVNAMSGTTYMPGAAADCKITIINHSGRNYKYVDNSFVIATEDNEAAVNNGWVSAVGDNVRSFDGTLIPLPYTILRTKNTAIQSLYGVQSTSSVTDAQMEDDALDKKLKEYTNGAGEHPYPNGVKQLNEYFVDFYNAEFHLNAEKLEDFSEAYKSDGERKNGRDVLGTIIFNGNKSKTKETNPEIAAASYNYFYNHLLVIGPSGMGQPSIADWDQYTVGQSMRNVANGSGTAFEKLCQASWGNLASGGSYALDGFEMYLHGPATCNVYQNYNYGFGLGFELEPTDGDFTIKKVDEDGNTITSPATFHLYKLAENGTTPLYYTENGQWSENQAEAKALVTENGFVTVSGINVGTYYILEAEAPEGYDKAADPMRAELDSDGLMISFTNIKTAIPGEYQITINYYEKGTTNKLHTSETQLYKELESLDYDVTNLVTGVTIDGYTFDSWENLQQAGLSGAIGQNLVFNVYYTKTAAPDPGPTPDPTPDKPSGGSHTGGGGSGPNTNTSTPDGGPGAVTVIPEEGVPMAAAIPEAPDALITITEEDVPMAQLPKTGDTTGRRNEMLLLVSGVLLAFCTLIKKKKEMDSEL